MNLKGPNPSHRGSGFTFIELLLVIATIGIIIAVIVPRAWRANIETKYGIVQQAATELGSWGMAWAERNLEAQDEADTCVLNGYVATLIGYTGDESTATNWTTSEAAPVYKNPPCRSNNINYTVADIMPAEKKPRNPFNGISYLAETNDGTSMQTGLLYLGNGTDDEGYENYYFVFTGTDSPDQITWHAGMGHGHAPLPLENLRNGIFMARLRPQSQSEE